MLVLVLGLIRVAHSIFSCVVFYKLFVIGFFVFKSGRGSPIIRSHTKFIWENISYQKPKGGFLTPENLTLWTRHCLTILQPWYLFNQFKMNHSGLLLLCYLGIFKFNSKGIIRVFSNFAPLISS